MLANKSLVLFKLGVLLAMSFAVVDHVNAQSGPVLPCEDCELNHVRPLPYEGSWYNPEQSGSGFLFDVQNYLLLGYYFGYDQNGSPIWATFSGRLEDASKEGALWKLTAELQKAKGGNCLNCDYQPPEADGSLGEIELTFNRMAHASFRVDGGPSQNIVPLYFGYPIQSYFPERTQFITPELQGWWTVFIDFNVPPPMPDEYTYANYKIHFSKGFYSELMGLKYSAILFPNPPEALDAGTIQCEYHSINNTEQPTCEIEINLFSTQAYTFRINLGDISAGRIYGETEGGDTIEMIRTSSDLCIHRNQPERCINTGLFGD